MIFTAELLVDDLQPGDVIIACPSTGAAGRWTVVWAAHHPCDAHMTVDVRDEADRVATWTVPQTDSTGGLFRVVVEVGVREAQRRAAGLLFDLLTADLPVLHWNITSDIAELNGTADDADAARAWAARLDAPLTTVASGGAPRIQAHTTCDGVRIRVRAALAGFSEELL